MLAFAYKVLPYPFRRFFPLTRDVSRISRTVRFWLRMRMLVKPYGRGVWCILFRDILQSGETAVGALARLYEYRELIHVLIARELKIRYRGAVLGFLWSFLNPLIFMSVYVLLFSVYMRLPVEHYPVFLLTGLLPWLWFSGSLSEATGSIIVNGSLVKKVRLPSEVFPLVSIGAHFVHLLLSLPILLLFLFAFGVGVSWTALWLPVVLLVQFVLTFGLALLSSSLAVRFRDLLHILPNLLTIWLFLTPVFYPSAVVPDAFKPLLLVNPMAHVIGAYQSILFYHAVPDLGGLLGAGALAALVYGLGHLVFEANTDLFAEEV